MAETLVMHKHKPTQKELEQNQIRFETELEFVQALANPWYLHSLAQQGHFSSPAFLNYLSYLRYFLEPKYAQFVHYPLGLQHLELLQLQGFRDACKDQIFISETLLKQELGQWAKWRQGKAANTVDVRDTGEHEETKVDRMVEVD